MVSGTAANAEIVRGIRVGKSDGAGDPVQADGDLIGRLPGAAEMAAKTLRLVSSA